MSIKSRVEKLEGRHPPKLDPISAKIAGMGEEELEEAISLIRRKLAGLGCPCIKGKLIITHYAVA